MGQKQIIIGGFHRNYATSDNDSGSPIFLSPTLFLFYFQGTRTLSNGAGALLTQGDASSANCGLGAVNGLAQGTLAGQKVDGNLQQQLPMCCMLS